MPAAAVLLMVLFAPRPAQGAAAADEITSLPGWERKLPSRHYSGFVDVSERPGESAGRFLHYWLVEAEEVDPATAPLVLWLNGGPGCSSMDGFWHVSWLVHSHWYLGT